MEVEVDPGSGTITWRFFSTSDGRQVTVSQADVQNVVPAPEPLGEIEFEWDPAYRDKARQEPDRAAYAAWLAAQGAARLLGSFSGNKGLARGRGLAGIGRAVGVTGDQANTLEGQAERISGDLRHDGVAALADVALLLVTVTVVFLVSHAGLLRVRGMR